MRGFSLIIIDCLWCVAAVVLQRFDFRNCEDGCYEIVSLPGTLGTRTNFKNGGHLFIRPCYLDMAEVFLESMTRDGPDVVPFIGTAGIGKSCLLLYILMKWFEREGQLQSFYYQISTVEIHFFEVTPEGIFKISTILAAGTTLSAEIPLFVDMQEQTLPKHHPGKVFIFSSFQPNRYKEITKEKVEYTIPTWSECEYAAYLSFDHFWADRNFDRALHSNLVQDSVAMYGGSFRNVVVAMQGVLGRILEIDWNIKAALQSKGASTAECVFVNGFHGGDADISDVLIHRNPPVDDAGDYVYGGKPVVYTVASSSVFEKLLDFNSSQYSAKMQLKFNGGIFSGGEDGKLFEYLCLNVFTLLERSFEIVSLYNSNLTQLITVPTIKTILTPNWRTVTLEQDVLYVPSHGTMESGDAFCLLNVQGVPSVIVFQITIAEFHPVKMQGLRVISDRFSNVGQQYLVFVTPQNGKLCTPQNLLTTESKVAQKFDGVQGFKDFQYKMENIF